MPRINLTPAEIRELAWMARRMVVVMCVLAAAAVVLAYAMPRVPNPAPNESERVR